MATMVRINRPISDELYNWIVARAVVLAVDRQSDKVIITLRGTPTDQDLVDMMNVVRNKQRQIMEADIAARTAPPDMESI